MFRQRDDTDCKPLNTMETHRLHMRPRQSAAREGGWKGEEETDEPAEGNRKGRRRKLINTTFLFPETVIENRS